jgi:riboflavin biosynthesis pyrimidine reductase
MYRIWPDTDHTPVDDETLIALYLPDYGRPLLRANFVTSVDGAVEVDGYSAGLGSPADQKVFGLLRMYPHALLVGAGTLRHEGYRAVRLDPPRHAWRAAHGLDPYPRLVVVSRRLDLDPTNPALADAPVRPVILTHDAAPPDRRTALSAVADVLALGETEVDLAAGLAALHARGMTQVLSEGGPHLLGALTAADLVDEMCLTISPMLTGPGAGRISAGPPSAVRGLTLAHALFDDDNLLLRYARGVSSESEAHS